jgi:hypothetical protein
MNFNIFFGNHLPSGKKSLLDFISWIYLSLKELDFHVSLSNSLCENSINLIFDNFYYDTNFFLKQKKIRYGLICTETPTGNTFNNLHDEYWVNRKKNFDKLIDTAEFLWTTWGIHKPYTNLVKNYGYLELSYNELYEKKYKKNIKKKYDFAFSGVLNNFRKNILEKFDKVGKLIVNNEFKSKKFYSSVIEQANFSISIQQSLNWICMPTTKIMNSLHLGTVPIILKPSFNDTSNLSNYCLKIEPNIQNEKFIYKDYEYLIANYKKNKSKITLKRLINDTIKYTYKGKFSFINSDFLSQRTIQVTEKLFLIRNFIFININQKKFQFNSDFEKLGIVIYNKICVYLINLLVKKLSIGKKLFL